MESLQAELRETSNKLKKALTGGSSDAISSAIDGAVELNGYKLVVAELQGLEAARPAQRLGHRAPEGRRPRRLRCCQRDREGHPGPGSPPAPMTP